MMAACGAVIYGGGMLPRYHNFGGLFAFSPQLAVQRFVRVAVESQIPIESVFGNHNLHHEGFDYRFGHILPLVDVGVPFQGVLQGVAAFGGIAPTYRIALLDKPTIVWDFLSLLIGLQMMFSFMMAEDKTPLRICVTSAILFL